MKQAEPSEVKVYLDAFCPWNCYGADNMKKDLSDAVVNDANGRIIGMEMDVEEEYARIVAKDSSNPAQSDT